MFDRNRLDISSLSAHYIVANVPEYLFEAFRRDASVRGVAQQYSTEDLAAELARILALPARTLEDEVVAQAVAVALTWKPNDEVVKALTPLPIKKIRWLTHHFARTADTVNLLMNVAGKPIITVQTFADLQGASRETQVSNIIIVGQ